MSGKCIHCGVPTKTRMSFTNESGVRFEYYSCMKGRCSTRSIDDAFNKKEDRQEEFGGHDFQMEDSVKAAFG